MTSIWSKVREEAVHAARQAPRLYFAPFAGAVRESVRVFREIQQENLLRSRAAKTTSDPHR
jgi:hypothetical protein